MVTARQRTALACRARPRRDPTGRHRGIVRLRLGARVRVAVAEQRLLAHLPPAPADLATVGDLPAGPRAERLAARALLRLLLAAELGRAAGATPIAARDGGQPHLPEWPGISVSLSHDAGTVAAALGRGVPVGVDVQVPVPAPPALLRRCCAPAVRAALDRLPAPARDREFAWIWTVQEACVKATGAGLAGRPWAIPVPAGRRTGRWADLRWVSLRGHSRVPASVAHVVGTR
ncbi:4'-phosphopantetheinyl transferase family protein [Micromonospora sp. DT46]|uniref:4'-phosphopantetheinyl transferase family protein n=1 Tax=unclassified Micromonospora TaxID=2617518 RepID=UPI002E11F8C4|nr:4'-phosphopantetheinyl transferase superfamily protein [Micromonospora sp. NBC_01740]